MSKGPLEKNARRFLWENLSGGGKGRTPQEGRGGRTKKKKKKNVKSPRKGIKVREAVACGPTRLGAGSGWV